MNESFKQENNKKEKIRISQMLNESSIADEKVNHKHRLTLVNVKQYNRNSKPKNKIFVSFWEKFRYTLYKGVDNIYVQVIILLIALYSLFYKEILILSLPISFDHYMHDALQIFFFILLAEFCVCLIAKKNYLFSFDFYIDIIALVGLIPEVAIIWYPLLNLISGSSEHGISNSITVSHISKATHVSQVGTKAGRYFKLFRLLDFVKIVRIAKILRTSGQISSLKSLKDKRKNGITNKESQVKNRKRRHNLTVDQRKNFDKLVELGIKYNIASRNPPISDQFIQTVERKETDPEGHKITEQCLFENESKGEFEKDAEMNFDKIQILGSRNIKRTSTAFLSKSNFMFHNRQANTINANSNMDFKRRLAMIDDDEYENNFKNTGQRKNKRKSSLIFRKFALKRTSTVGFLTNKYISKGHKLQPAEIYKETDDENEEENSNLSKSISSVFSEENNEDNMDDKEEELLEKKIELSKEINRMHMSKFPPAEIFTVDKEKKPNLIKKVTLTLPSKKQEDFLRNVSHQSNSKIQKILDENMIKQAVVIIMLVLVTIPIIDFEFLETIIYSSDMIPKKQDFCIGLIYLQMNYTFYNLDTSSLNLLNSTISNCFYEKQYIDEHNSLPGLERFLSIDFNQSELFWQVSNATGFMNGKSMIAIDNYDEYIGKTRDTYDYSIETYSIDANNSITFYYEIVEGTHVTDICTIVKSVYVMIFLIIGVYMSTILVNTVIISPLDIIFTKLSMSLKHVETNRNINDDYMRSEDYVFKLNDIFDNNDSCDDIVYEPLSKDDKILQACVETSFIDASLNKMLNLISISIGNLAFPIIPYSNLNQKNLELNLTRTPIISFEGVGLFLFIQNTDMFFNKYQNRSTTILSEIYTIFHSIGIIFSGEPYVKSEFNAIFWKRNKNKWLSDTDRYLIELISGKKGHKDNDRILNKQESEAESNLNKIVDSLAVFCGIKFLYILFKDLNKTMKIMRECNVTVSLYVQSGVYMHGLFGTENIIQEVYLGESIEYMLKLSRAVHSDCLYPSLFISEDSYNFTIEEIKRQILPYEVVLNEESRCTEILYRHFFNYFYFSDHEGINFFSYWNMSNITIFRERKDLENQITKDINGFLNFVLSDESYYIITEGFNRSLKTLSNLFLKSFENVRYSKCLELLNDCIDVIATDEDEFDPVIRLKLTQFENIIKDKIYEENRQYYTTKLA